MKVTHYEQIEAMPVNTEGAVNCKMRCLIGPDQACAEFFHATIRNRCRRAYTKARPRP